MTAEQIMTAIPNTVNQPLNNVPMVKAALEINKPLREQGLVVYANYLNGSNYVTKTAN